MFGIEKRLKKLKLLDEAITNENDEWGNTPENWEVHLEILIAGGAVEEDLLFSLSKFPCPYVKLDGSICNKNSTRIEGCKDHWKKIRVEGGKPCRTCGKLTRSTNGLCYKHNGGSQMKRYKRMQQNSI